MDPAQSKELFMQSLKPNRAEAKAPPAAAHFEGHVVVHTLVPASDQKDLEVLAVFFDDGGRTRPHIHSVDQLLVVVEGRIVVATQTERIELVPGESAMVPKGEWHWHGAVKHTNACHLSIKKAGPTDWSPPLYNFTD
jgi:quercetin dioxygenase-like cupin family protein